MFVPSNARSLLLKGNKCTSCVHPLYEQTRMRLRTGYAWLKGWERRDFDQYIGKGRLISQEGEVMDGILVECLVESSKLDTSTISGRNCDFHQWYTRITQPIGSTYTRQSRPLVTPILHIPFIFKVLDIAMLIILYHQTRWSQILAEKWQRISYLSKRAGHGHRVSDKILW